MKYNKNVFTLLGASNHTQEEREPNDYYATDPKAVRLLLDVESFSPTIWEPACGEGHISEELKSFGHDVISSDLIDRGYGAVSDFFTFAAPPLPGIDIITNPPYKYAQRFTEHALDISAPGTKIAMFLRLQFLESQSRRILFDAHPPKTVYVFSSRVLCAKNGDFDRYRDAAQAFAWFVWIKGFSGDTVVKWIN